MSRLIDRIKDTLQGTSKEQHHDHESGGAHSDADKPAQVAPGAGEHEHPSEHEHDEKAHKHC